MTDSVFLFPGQGSQSVGMLAELAHQTRVITDTFAEASDALELDLWALCQQGPEEALNRTTNTQPAMLAADIATWRAWQAEGGPMPASMAGHSLGEYAALVAANAMDFRDAVRLVAERGRLMQAAVPEGEGAMAAILGLEDGILADVCRQVAQGEVVSCANFNSPGQVVIAGQAAAVARACEAASEAGARRAMVLPVSVPSHCLLMQEAAEKLAHSLTGTAIRTPDVPVVQNADVAAFDDPAHIRDALARQLWQPVQWTRTIQYHLDSGVKRFFECGPGKVLCGLNRRISRESECTGLASLKAIQDAIGGN